MKTKTFKILLALAITLVIYGCGGGGDKTTKAPTQTKQVTEVSTKKDVVLVDNNNSKEILQKDGNVTNRSILVTQNMAKDIEVGKVLHIPAGIDSRFPLGFSGKVVKKFTVGNKVKIEFKDVDISDVLTKLKQPKIKVPLRKANIIGVIAPSAVSSISTNNKILPKNSKRFLNGAVIYIPNKNDKLSTSGSISTTNDEILLNMKIDFSKFVSDATKLKPIGGKTNGQIIIQGSISDMNFVGSYDAGFEGVSPYLAMQTKLNAKLNAEVEFKGTASLDLGSYNRAWKEVEDDVFKKYFINLDVKGLKSKDKIGKFPIVGIVYQTPTPITYHGETQTPLRQAKKGGFILWVYLDAKGKVSVDGEIGVATHVNFEMGISKEKGKKFTISKKINPIAGKRLLEAPFIDGKVTLKSQIGISADLDTFIGGIRIANLGINAQGVWTQTYETDKRLSYGIDKLGDKWSWKGGRICQESRLEAGVKIDGAANFSVDDKKIIDNISFSLPLQSDIDATTEGWVGGLWYVTKPKRVCFNNNPPKTTYEITKDDNGNYNITLITEDEEHDPITYTISKPPSHGTITGTMGNLIYIPYKGYTGTDSFELTTYDGYDTTKISIPINVQTKNQPPIANAGEDFSVNEGETVVLDASASSDSDGNIVSYVWKEGNTIIGNGVSIALDNVSVGKHIYTLTVTDDKGATSSDSVIVTVGKIIVETSKVKKTGQTKSYDQDGNEVTNGSVKDDGYYQKGVTPSYTRDNKKEVVIDNVTGLMWQDNADVSSVKLDWNNAISYCQNLTLGGYNDWRLPTIEELESIVDFGHYEPAVTPKVFQYVASNYYWSSSPWAYFTDFALLVDFSTGESSNYYYANYNHYLRCVRDRK